MLFYNPRTDRFRLNIGGRSYRVELSEQEHKLLLLFWGKPAQQHTKAEMCEQVWGGCKVPDCGQHILSHLLYRINQAIMPCRVMSRNNLAAIYVPEKEFSARAQMWLGGSLRQGRGERKGK